MRGNVVVFSYNRPRMVREAIDSVLRDSFFEDTVCWVVDDGSDFEILDLYEEYKDSRLVIAKGSKIPSRERATDGSRFADNINYVLGQMNRGEFVMFMCDDDIVDKMWLRRLSDFFESNKMHLALGDTYYFYDGENPHTEARFGFKTMVDRGREDLIWWNVGNWAHRTECFFDEGLRWKPSLKAHSWDVEYITDLQTIHRAYIMLKIPSLYRREHNKMVSVKLGRVSGDPMSEESSYALAPNEMTPEMVEGWME